MTRPFYRWFRHPDGVQECTDDDHPHVQQRIFTKLPRGEHGEYRGDMLTYGCCVCGAVREIRPAGAEETK